VTDRVTPPLVPDLVTLDVPKGGRVVVISDQHLSDPVTDAGRATTAELMRVLAGWDGPGVLVIAGDGFELLAGVNPNIHRVLDAHAEWAAAIKTFATRGSDRHVVVLSGNHDGPIAWDADVVAALRDRLGAQIAIAADLIFDTGQGPEKVHVVHGNQDDPYNRFIDVRSPIDTPLGHHVVRDVLPQLEKADRPGDLLEGVPWLNDSSQIAEFVASRLLYRKIGGRLWWLAVPFLAAVLLRLITFLPGVDDLLRAHAERWLIGLGVAVVGVLVVAGVAAAITMLRVHDALVKTGELTSHTGVSAHNAAARERAARLITSGYAGMISGHTHDPELSVVGTGFYANAGCGVETVGAHPARFGLPRPFLAFRRCSRVELAAHDVLEVRLVVGDIPVRSPSVLERLVTKRDPNHPATPKVVGALPSGSTWPTETEELGEWVRRRRVRRVAAALLLVAGVLNLVSALLPVISSRLRMVERVMPLHVPRAAGVLATLGGLALLGLARPIRRGYRPAWLSTLLLLGTVTVSLLLRSFHIEQAVLTAALALWLLSEHRHFRVDPPGRSRWLVWGLSLGLGALVLASTLAIAFDRSERLTRDVIALIVGVIVLGAIVAARAGRVGAAPDADERAATLERARQVVHQYGGDTLDYFALRDDKEILFTGRGIVAYTMLDRTMLVSPDPIGPPEERTEMWADAMGHADANGWAISVLAANASWLPTYHSAGLQDIYIGDEAIVDCQHFSLEGKAMKSLRGAHNRMAKNGYRVQMFDPSTVEPVLKEQLLALMTETRQGDVERGFSMTLSRMFDSADTGLLLAVCFDADGAPKAFNQYMPAAAIDGYSLDVMRRTSDPDVPNGLTDFVVTETIDWMRQRGMRGLGLNFATMRAVLAGELGTGPWRAVERKTLHHFSDTMQIESLWRFNQKYDPTWRPRYIVTDCLLDRPRAGAAIARAESLFELPVVGSLLKAPPPEAFRASSTTSDVVKQA
jgi:lysylphosphatidylglycerol synthetase-like protein (DUF2156 family)/UDP-2,3-diacylglucosamine pyrophosphatase LpxH